MSEWGGLVPTGRRISGPSADLVELDDGRDGLKHTAIAFHERYRGHSVLNRGIEIIRSFLDFPMVTGLLEVSAWLPDQGVFVYPTGTSWTAMELLRSFRDRNQTVSPRAVGELLYLSSMILQDAADVGPLQGVFSHGALSPSRLLFKEDGQAQMIGYGLPQVEIIVWRDDPSVVPHEDAFRYCPPERMRGGLEESSADVFSLGLIAAELLTNEPVYNGTLDAIRDQAAGGEAARRFEKLAKGKVPAPLKDLVMGMLAGDPGDRIGEPADVVEAAEKVLDRVNDGLPLANTMEEVRNQTRRGKSIGGTDNIRGRGVPIRGPEPGKSGPAIPLSAVSMHTFSNHPGARAAESAPEAPEEQKRWGKSQRSKGEETPAPAAPRAAAPASDARDRLRDRMKKGESADPAPVVVPAPAPAVDPKQALRDRLKRSSAEEPAAAPPAAAPPPAAPASATPAEAPKDPKEALRDRLRRSASEAPASPPETPAVDPKEALRERLRRSAADTPAASPTAAPGPTPAAAVTAPAAAPVTAPATAETTKPADARDALRDRLRRSREETAEPAKTVEEPAPAKAVDTPKAAEPAPVSGEDRRSALKDRLKRKE